MSKCNTCGRDASAPYRVYDARGKCTAGCVDDFHTGHLVTPSESSRWHNRPDAKKIRAALKRGQSGKGYGMKKNPARSNYDNIIRGTAGNVRIVRDSEWQEYTARPFGSKRESWYHTSDLAVARATARVMANDARYFTPAALKKNPAPRNMHNIEKSGFHRGEYVGYGGGTVWRIRQLYGGAMGWDAIARDKKYTKSITRSTLQEISEALDKLDSGMKKNPAPERSSKSFMGMRVSIHKAENETWLESEEAAYPRGGKTRDGEARLNSPTGALVKIKAGIADTAWTVPATAQYKGKKYAGYISYDENVIVFHSKKLSELKTNPRPRIGTKSPRRRSSVTGKFPTVRLVARRKRNARKGYFPNPTGAKVYSVQMRKSRGWVSIHKQKTRADAIRLAKTHHNISPSLAFRVIKR
jgi:hypothetical protein